MSKLMIALFVAAGLGYAGVSSAQTLCADKCAQDHARRQ